MKSKDLLMQPTTPISTILMTRFGAPVEETLSSMSELLSESLIMMLDQDLPVVCSKTSTWSGEGVRRGCGLTHGVTPSNKNVFLTYCILKIPGVNAVYERSLIIVGRY